MNTTDFIITELDKLIKQFPEIRVRYGYDTNNRTHFVEIVPNSIYYKNNDYALRESEIFQEFAEQYPTENICFISDDAVVDIENYTYVNEGMNYSSYSVVPEVLIESPNLFILGLQFDWFDAVIEMPTHSSQEIYVKQSQKQNSIQTSTLLPQAA